jgi:putative flippase GtrA
MQRVDLARGFYTRFRVLIHEVAKFGAVGIIAFFITIGGANALRYGAGLGPLTSVTIATVVATVFAFLGNKLWAFRHRRGSHWGRESALFFVFNGIGLLIQLGVVGVATHALGLNDKLSYNVANIVGIGVATIFRLYCYRRWVFLMADDALQQERLEPETSGT